MEQIQLGYNPVQDRLIMSIKEKEQNYKVWLTRRFVMLFLAQLHKSTENDPVVKQQQNTPHKSDIMAFQKQQAELQGNVNRSKEPIKVDEAADTVVLATGIQVEGQTLHILCLDNKRLSLGLNTGLSYGLIKLIEQALTHTNWGFKGVKPAVKKDTDVTARANWSVSIN